MLTELQKHFIELDKKKEEIKRYYEDLEATLECLVAEQGLNSYFQDEEGIVYRLCEPDGRYIKFDKHGYVRTKRPGEKAGTLSVKEAKEKGFNIE